MRMFITSKNKYLSNDMKIFGTCSIPLKNPIENDTKHLVFSCETHQLAQVIDKPTRVTPTGRSLVDIVIASNAEHIAEYDLISLGISDHHLTYFVLCNTMACFDVISLSLISGGDHPFALYFLWRLPLCILRLWLIMTSQWVMTLLCVHIMVSQ